MKTNFTKENFLVLTNNENKIVAIIQCQKGQQDISEKLIQAIGEDYDTESVKILDKEETVLNDFDYEFDFTARIITDGDKYKENFSLTFTQVY